MPKEYVVVSDLAKKHDVPAATLYSRLRKHPDYGTWERSTTSGAPWLLPPELEDWLINYEYQYTAI